MEIKDVQRKKGARRYARESKIKRVNIGIQKFESDWMRKHNISPTAIMIVALKELGCPQPKVFGEEKDE